jgi:hypothetical protein
VSRPHRYSTVISGEPDEVAAGEIKEQTDGRGYVPECQGVLAMFGKHLSMEAGDAAIRAPVSAQLRKACQVLDTNSWRHVPNL